MTAVRNHIELLSTSGCVLLPGAVSGAAIDQYCDELSRAARERPHDLMLLENGTGLRTFDWAVARTAPNRLTETPWALGDAPTAALWNCPAVVELLTSLYESPVLCFQSFHLEAGLGMRLHQESWYIPLRDPSDPGFSVWIALEDQQEGSG